MQRLSMPESKSNPQSSLRCHHCAGPLTKEMETSQWTVRPLIRDSFSMIGSAVGGTTSAFYGFNHVMPVVRRWVKGPMWLHFFIGAPPVIVFSSACAGLAGGAVPALAQLASSSYHAAFSAPSLPPPSQDDKGQKSRNSSTLMAMTCFLVMISINSHFFSIANLLKIFPLSKSSHAATLLKFSG